MPTTLRPASPAAAMLCIDREFRIHGWPTSAEVLFGWSPDEALGRDLLELLGCTPSSHEPMRAWSACQFLAQHRRKDGQAIHVHLAFEPMRGSGAPCGVVTLHDAEPPSKPPFSESEARYESVVAAMQEGVIVQDHQGQILTSNAAAQCILGLTAEELRDRTTVDPRWRTVYPDGSPFPSKAYPMLVTLRTGAPQSGVIMGVHKPDGSLAWISINSQPICADASAGQSAVVATFTDITEARAIALQCEQDQQRMQQVLAENATLIAELRLALDGVRTLAGLLPVCAWCKSVRDDKGYWQQLEVYLTEHTDAQLTHGLCPACSTKLTKE